MCTNQGGYYAMPNLKATHNRTIPVTVSCTRTSTFWSVSASKLYLPKSKKHQPWSDIRSAVISAACTMVPNLNSRPLVDCTTSPNNSNQSDNRMLPYPPMDVSAIAASLAYSSEKCVVCNDNDVHHTCAHTRVNANTPRLPIFPQ